MAEFSKLVITRKGQALLAKMLAGQGNIEFSKISASTAFYEVEQLDALEELPDVKQANKISKITRTNDVAVKVETAFSNTELTEGYYMRTLGLYAIDPDEGEILYAATTETTGNCYMPAYNGVTVSGVYVQLVTTVGNAENVSIKIDQAAIATIGNIQDLQAQIDMILGKSSDGSGLQFAEGLDAKNVVDGINKVFLSGSERRAQLVANLTAMGIEADTSETLEELIDKVLEMTNTSEDTVTEAVLLEGYTAHDATGEQVTGIIPEYAAVTVDATNVTQDSDYTYFEMPEGHYNAQSKVRSANSNIADLMIDEATGFTESHGTGSDRNMTYTFTTSGIAIITAIANNSGSATVRCTFVSTTCSSYKVVVNNINIGGSVGACTVICDAKPGDTITINTLANVVTFIGCVK